VRCLESSVTDFGNVFHFRKDRPTALNSNIQIPHAAQAPPQRQALARRVRCANSKQSANPNFQNLFLTGSGIQNKNTLRVRCWFFILSCFGHWYLFAIWDLLFGIFASLGNGSNTEHSSRISNCHFLGTELMRRGTRRGEGS
jgi:hypothetical protein